MKQLSLLLLSLLISASTSFAAQPTTYPNKPAVIWDELNSNFIYEEISHQTGTVNSGVINTASAVLDMKKNTLAQFQVIQLTGTITDAVATLQHSNNGVTFVNTATTLTNAGVSAQAVVGRYVRVVFTTPSTLASTATVIIVGR